MATGKIVSCLPQQTIADGASTPHIGELNLPIMQKHVDTILGVSDEELIDGMRMFSERCKVISEPTGCLGLAGIKRLVRSGVIKPGERVGCLITGGNVDMQRFTTLLMKDTAKPALQVRTRINSTSGVSDTTADTHFDVTSTSSDGDQVTINSTDS